MIEVKNINLEYDDKKVFNELSFKIDNGEKILLNMESGTGKTSLLKILMGFKQPDSGEVIIDGDVLNQDTVKRIRHKFAYLPQNISFPSGKVEDVITGVLKYNANQHLKYDRQEIEELFNELSLDKAILLRKTNELSGGEKQRLGIILMRLLKREYYLLDEVTSALNIELKSIIKDYFISLPNTVIIVSHDEVWNLQSFRKVRW